MCRYLLVAFFSPLICPAQNVGIGVVPTKGILEVAGAVGNNVAIFGGDGAGVSVQQNWPAIGFNQYYNTNTYTMAAGGGWVEYLDMNSGSFAFDHVAQTSTPNAVSQQSRRLTIRQNGNVSINATEANATLFVGGANIGLPSAIFRGTTYNSVFYEQAVVGKPYRNTYINGGKAGSHVLINNKLGGNVIIGNGSAKVGINIDPTDVFEVKQYNGRGLALINPSYSYWELFVEKNLVESNSDLYVYYNGQNYGNFYNGDGKYYYYSDSRVKANIQTLASTLSGVMQLKPCTYEIKFDNPSHMQSIGLIAQEAGAVFPELTEHITGDDLGYGGMKDIYSINYDALGPLAVKAIQEQQAKLEALRKQVAMLKQRVAAAEKSVLAGNSNLSATNQ
jgi:hypothetical protein